MLEQALFRERVQELLAAQRQAEEAYARLMQTATDAQLREQLEQLHRDKQRHIRLTEQLLEILG